MDNPKVMALVERCRWSTEAVDLGVRAGFRCEYCGRDLLASIDDYDTWERDHIDPYAENPFRENLDNLAVSCRLCNKIKRRWIPGEGWKDDQNREQRIAVLRNYIGEQRRAKESLLNEIKGIIHYAGL